ncbi:MAG: glycosyltransferase family 1 protein [Treponema sp.]|nr:glycosyltransferase family 1 protein [Treponema sp.]
MKVGIYLNIPDPTSGGAGSLLSTINEEIKSSNDNIHDFVFLYEGKKSDGFFKEIDGMYYYNIGYFRPFIIVRVINKLLRIIKIKTNRINPFDLIIKKTAIDITWMVQPCCVNTKYPYIYTIWDLGHRTTPYFPEVSRTGWLWQEREDTYQKMVFKASYIITGNEEGKQEILQNYNVNPQKIFISSFPVAKFCKGEEIHPDFELPEYYFFYPAQFWPHKNHIRIVQAVKLLKDQGIDVTVYFTGADKGNKSYIEEKIKELNLSDNIKFTGFLKDEELKYLYSHATAMIFASLMGPNNMPPIEATYLNCPVIITDLNGHKEQLGDSALYFDGLNSVDLADKMKMILKDENLRDNLKQRQQDLKENFADINYFDKIKTVLDEFSKVRETWGNDYVHL